MRLWCNFFFQDVDHLCLLFLIAQIPSLPEAMLVPGGLLTPAFDATRLIGRMVVPMAVLIVGAKIYTSRMKVSCQYLGKRAICALSRLTCFSFILFSLAGQNRLAS